MNDHKLDLLSLMKGAAQPPKVPITAATDRAGELLEMYRKDNPCSSTERLDLYGNEVFGMSDEGVKWLRNLQQISLERTLAEYGSLRDSEPRGIDGIRFIGIDYPKEVAEDAVEAVRRYIEYHPEPRED